MNESLFLTTILCRSSELYLSRHEMDIAEDLLSRPLYEYYIPYSLSGLLDYLLNNFLPLLQEKFPDEHRLIYT